jgi:CRP-like cAMP-binding protein
LTTVSHPDRVFPTLTPAQIARVARHGQRRPMASGEVLVEAGQRPVRFFVVSNGDVQALRPSG